MLTAANATFWLRFRSPSYPSVSCVIPYCSSFLYRLLRGVPMTSAVFEMFQSFSRSLLDQERALGRFLELAQRAGRVPSRSSAAGAACGFEPHDVAEIVDVDGLARRHDEQTLDGVPQLADVALPARLLQVARAPPA